jgi:hypothetical protein
LKSWTFTSLNSCLFLFLSFTQLDFLHAFGGTEDCKMFSHA